MEGTTSSFPLVSTAVLQSSLSNFLNFLGHIVHEFFRTSKDVEAWQLKTALLHIDADLQFPVTSQVLQLSTLLQEE